MTDLTGTLLNDYRVLRRLGRGAMAEVYLAEQQSLARQVALKVLSAELAAQPAYVERFKHEARSAAALVHANIVQVYEVGQSNGSHFIAQEYVAGQNVAEWLNRHGRADPARVLDILRQVAAALSKAHERSIVHRDVKPENIMLARSGEVKVADFGLARVTTDDGTQRTQAGVAMGTPLYMSPEQIEGRPIDSRSDIYSLGVTAYHMLAGEPPFTGDTPLAVAVQHINKQPPSLADRAPDTPNALVELVERMMAKAPEDRFADPVDLLRVLRALAKQAAEQGWAEGPENWSMSDLATVPTGIAATGELQQLMQGTRALEIPRSNRRRTVRLVAIALAAGAVLALIARRPYVLAGAQPPVLEYETARAQLFHAKVHDTPDAWQAVLARFPNADDAFERNQAKQGLARYYLRSRDYGAALPYLNDLAALPKNQRTTRTFALVALTVAHAELGNVEEALSVKGRLAPADVDRMQTDADLIEKYRTLEL